MKLENIQDLVKSAMTYERQRVEVAGFNLSIANVALDGQAVSSPLRQAAVPSQFWNYLDHPPIQTSVESGFREVHDPAHPLADDRGMVRYPKVDTAREMATLVSANRAYEADIRAYNALRAMNLKAFDIGKQ
ncbi:flagellar basal-body rod protein FlgC [Fluviicoccus keumensis]|uniref:Flagellar basal-body rod protein FlgC n=1 Tax=Fluviicoccus keumensis TaxID=1435465 RepID=A0A4Q7YND9_9GAMM|nr:flagellar basal body rod C-terminal domain-containing protein [Fluviicoccus keumensis]RZU38504.1 flagellar basal-body rod protein FlgC [Fluviicoccus keumensis]